MEKGIGLMHSSLNDSSLNNNILLDSLNCFIINDSHLDNSSPHLHLNHSIRIESSESDIIKRNDSDMSFAGSIINLINDNSHTSDISTERKKNIDEIDFSSNNNSINKKPSEDINLSANIISNLKNESIISKFPEKKINIKKENIPKFSKYKFK